MVQFSELRHYQYQRLASRRAGTRAFRQTFIAVAMNPRKSDSRMQSTVNLNNAHQAGERNALPDMGTAPPSRQLPSYQPKVPAPSATFSPKLPSERRFGFTFAAALAGLGVYGIIRHRNRTVCIVFIVSSIVFTLLTLIIPRALAPLNKAWFHLGEALGKIVSPIVLGIIFFVILAPVSIMTRLFGRDELRLKRRAINSYWIDRSPPDPTANSFKNQF